MPEGHLWSIKFRHISEQISLILHIQHQQLSSPEILPWLSKVAGAVNTTQHLQDEGDGDWLLRKMTSDTSEHPGLRHWHGGQIFSTWVVTLNNKLDLSHSTGALYGKGQSRLHLLRRLWSVHTSAKNFLWSHYTVAGEQAALIGTEVTEQAGQESQLCPGMPAGEEDVSQVDIQYWQPPLTHGIREWRLWPVASVADWCILGVGRSVVGSIKLDFNNLFTVPIQVWHDLSTAGVNHLNWPVFIVSCHRWLTKLAQFTLQDICFCIDFLS